MVDRILEGFCSHVFLPCLSAVNQTFDGSLVLRKISNFCPWIVCAKQVRTKGHCVLCLFYAGYLLCTVCNYCAMSCNHSRPYNIRFGFCRFEITSFQWYRTESAPDIQFMEKFSNNSLSSLWCLPFKRSSRGIHFVMNVSESRISVDGRSFCWKDESESTCIEVDWILLVFYVWLRYIERTVERINWRISGWWYGSLCLENP